MAALGASGRELLYSRHRPEQLEVASLMDTFHFMTGLTQTLTDKRCPRRQSVRQRSLHRSFCRLPGAAAALNLHVCSGSKVPFLGTPRDIDHCQLGCREQLGRGTWEGEDSQGEQAIGGASGLGATGPGFWLPFHHLTNFGKSLALKVLSLSQQSPSVSQERNVSIKRLQCCLPACFTFHLSVVGIFMCVSVCV